VSQSSAPTPPGDRMSRGFGRVLIIVYGVFGVSATARASYQIVRDFGEAPVAFSLSAFAAVVCRVATAAVLVELVGVLVVGSLSLAAPDAFPRETVWSGFGRGYGLVPLVLPVVGLWWLWHTRPHPARS